VTQISKARLAQAVSLAMSMGQSGSEKLGYSLRYYELEQKEVKLGRSLSWL